MVFQYFQESTWTMIVLSTPRIPCLSDTNWGNVKMRRGGDITKGLAHSISKKKKKFFVSRSKKSILIVLFQYYLLALCLVLGKSSHKAWNFPWLFLAFVRKDNTIFRQVREIVLSWKIKMFIQIQIQVQMDRVYWKGSNPHFRNNWIENVFEFH